jgi:hypothetical protein
MDSRAAEETVLLIRDYLCDIKPVSLKGNRLFCCQSNPGRKGGELFLHRNLGDRGNIPISLEIV